METEGPLGNGGLFLSSTKSTYAWPINTSVLTVTEHHHLRQYVNLFDVCSLVDSPEHIGGILKNSRSDVETVFTSCADFLSTSP